MKAVARARAIMGGLFSLLGVAIGVRLLAAPVPFTHKILGLGFAVVLVAFGVVRVRTYLAIARSEALR